MSSEIGHDWDEILKGKWKAYDVEKYLYVDSVNKANSPEERAKVKCDGLREGDVPLNYGNFIMRQCMEPMIK